MTGASQGIGEAIARALAGAGARVGLAARSESNLERLSTEICEKMGAGAAIALPTDVTDNVQVCKSVRTCQEKLGPVTILVNCAGVMVSEPCASD